MLRGLVGPQRQLRARTTFWGGSLSDEDLSLGTHPLAEFLSDKPVQSSPEQDLSPAPWIPWRLPG